MSDDGSNGGDEVSNSEHPIANMAELLRVTHCRSVQGLCDLLADEFHSEVYFDDVSDDGFTAVFGSYGRGIGFSYPVTVAEIYADLQQIEDEHWMPIHLAGLEEEITEMEGFEVIVEVDEKITDRALLESVGRYTTMNGTVVQQLPRDMYRYRTRATGTMTVEEWLRARFLRRLPGLRVSVYGEPWTPLRELRRPTRPWRLRSYGIGELRRYERARQRARMSSD